jgi:CheY-like chemotaxis protein
MMTGHISVESESGKGSVFTVRLPQRSCGSVICGADVVNSLRDFSFSNTAITKKAQIVQERMPYGRVLVVDDVESNLYVARGLLAPYGLSIDTAKSGAEAIEKINDGGVYDIVFMDHMMPVMDGIKATNILRGSGYDRPIVALTANAITGQSEIFLSNGFNRFISKPIDSRELDIVLKEFILNSRPPVIPEETRQEKNEAAGAKRKNSSELEKYFIIDAEEAVNMLEGIYQKIDRLDGSDIESFVITVHGIKSALANIGETELSGFARELENAGKTGNSGFMTDETPLFIGKLKSLIHKLKQAETAQTAVHDSAALASGGDMLYLKEKLIEFTAACEAYNIRAAETFLNDLKQKAWPQEIDDAMKEISVNILRGEFENAVSVAERILNTPGN